MAQISKNIFWLSLSRVFGLALLFLAYTQLFRYLGPFGTGQYQFVLSLVAIFGVVVDLGISQYVIKKIAEAPEQASKYFHTFFAAEIVLAAFVYLVMMGFALARGYETVLVQALAVAGAGLFLYGLTVPFLAVLSAFQDIGRVAIINLLSSVVNATIIFLAIHYDRYIVFLASQQFIYGVGALVIYHQFIKRHIAAPHLFTVFRYVDWHLLKKILKAAAPFALLVSFSTIYNRIDVVLITKLRGFEDAGLYTTAYKIVDLTNFFPAVVSHSLYPALAALMAKKQIADVRTTLEKYLRLMIFMALPLAVGGTLLSRQLILVLTSGDARFLPAAPVLAILVWAIALLFIYVTANSLVISQLTKLAVLVTGANVVVNIVGNLVLLPRLGIQGAAIMTVVSEALQCIFYFYFVWKGITHFSLARQLAKPLFAAACMGLVLWFVRGWSVISVPLDAAAVHLLSLIINLVAVGAIGVAAYIAALFVSGFFTKEDLVFVKRFLKR